MDGFHRRVERLVYDFPDKAVDIILSHCHDQHTVNDIMAYLADRTTQHDARGSARGLNITVGTTTPSLPPLDTEAPNSSLTRDVRSRRLSSYTSAATPMSPPRTVSSTASHSSIGGNRSAEDVLLYGDADEDLKPKLVRMKTAAIEHSVIRDDIVHSRNLGENLNAIPPFTVQVPQRGAPSNVVDITTRQCVQITWRRRTSDSTHLTMFYVVPQTLLDADVLLGCADSGEPLIDHATTIAPQPQRHHEYNFRNFNQQMPSAPTPPHNSYHPSAVSYNSASHERPMHHAGQHNPPFLDALLSRQQNVAPHRQIPPQASPTPTVLDSRSSPAESSQPLGRQAWASDPRNGQGRETADRLRVCLTWDKTTMSLWLETAAPADNFFDAFRQAAEKRKRVFNRPKTTIFFKRDKSSPDDEDFELPLDEESLEADWVQALDWLEENKRDTTPHIYGRVQVDEG